MKCSSRTICNHSKTQISSFYNIEANYIINTGFGRLRSKTEKLLPMVTFFFEAMLAAALAAVTNSDNKIGTGKETLKLYYQNLNHEDATIKVKNQSTQPSAAPPTNHPCIQSKIPYSSPQMDCLTTSAGHNHTTQEPKTKDSSMENHACSLR